MTIGSSFFIAIRYLLGRAHEGGRYLRGAAGGIALSLIPIMVTLIVSDGMIRGITDRYLELGTGHLQVYDFLDAQDVESALPLIAAARENGGLPGEDALRGITGVWAERQGLGVLMGAKGKSGASIRAVDPAFWEEPGSGKFLKTIEGSSHLESDREVLLGEELARSVGAGVGKMVYIMTVTVGADGRNIPRTLPYTVRGIVSSGYRELDSLWCIMSYEGGRKLLAPELSSHYLMVKIDDPYKKVDDVAWTLSRILGPGYSVYTWQELQRSQSSSYESTRQMLLFIMALIVVVAAVNVSSATSMLVIERRRDIAVLKAGGASPAGIVRIFLWGSFLTGLTGGVIGISLGLCIGYFVNPIIHGLERLLGFFSNLFHGDAIKILDPGYYLETIPVIIDWNMVLVIFFFTLFSSILASLIPARQAGKTAPLDILRKY
ncbi:ABC transporter substrate-binding protein [Spirochaetia bacterium]|nr:ABC transporter substrate-binding protein [Spirochaetia bacterium]